MKSLKKLLGKEEPNPVCKNIRYSQEWQGMRKGSEVIVMNSKDKNYNKKGRIVDYRYPVYKVAFGRGPVKRTGNYYARELMLIKNWEVVD